MRRPHKTAGMRTGELTSRPVQQDCPKPGGWRPETASSLLSSSVQQAQHDPETVDWTLTRTLKPVLERVCRIFSALPGCSVNGRHGGGSGRRAAPRSWTGTWPSRLL